MIELKKNDSSEIFQIYIDEKLCEDAYFVESNYVSESLQASSDLSSQTIDDFFPFVYIRLKNFYDWSNFENVFGISTNHGEKSKQLHIEIIFLPDLMNWRNDFTFTEYFELFDTGCREKSISHGLKFDTGDTPSFWFSFETDFFEGSIKDFFLPLELKLKEIHTQTLKQIKERKSVDILSLEFRFPEEVKTYCEQYLCYFASFLQDLGINSTSNLTEEAGKVLFSVTPTDNVEALDKIREALAVYLNLPSSPIVYDDSFAAMRLQQQIENLHHSQKMATRELQFNEKLLVAQSEMIHEKNVTISQLQSNNEQLIKIVEKISSPTIMMDSAENKEELEEIYDGLKVGESETLKKWLGISLNPAKAIKTVVKNTFGKDSEKNSVLGLDEDVRKD